MAVGMPARAPRSSKRARAAAVRRASERARRRSAAQAGARGGGAHAEHRGALLHGLQLLELDAAMADDDAHAPL
eukprot:4686698-Prymnesium_polylepis.1